MFAVGHIALGYLIGKILSKLSHVETDTPVLMTLSILPDIDLLIPGIKHRGPTHSVLFITLFSILIIIYTRKLSLPYIGSLAGHSLIGDYITDGGIQLLWPHSLRWFRSNFCLSLDNYNEFYLETGLFFLLLVTIYFSGDLNRFLKPSRSNRLLLIPIASIVLPAFLYYPIRIPNFLFVQHIGLLGLIGLSFILSILTNPKLQVSDLKK